MLKKAESEKKITEIKVAKLAPFITHLMFADDTLLFCKATKGELQVLSSVLKSYENLSG